MERVAKMACALSVRTRAVSGFPSRWACRTWTTNAFQHVVDLLCCSIPSSSDPHPQQQQQNKEKEKGDKQPLGLPGFRGAERPSMADIHMLCHVFQHSPWSPSVEKHLRLRNFCLTSQQVTQVLHLLKANLTHTLNFFIWAGQQRGQCYSAEAFDILKKTIEENIGLVHPMLKDMETDGRFIPLEVLMLLVELYAEKNMVQNAVEVFQTTANFGSRPDEDAYNSILQILVDAGLIDDANVIFEQMKADKWCRPGKTAYNLVFYGLGKAGKMAEARKLVCSLKSSNEISGVEAHSRLVDGLCEGGWMGQAEEAVIEMYELGLEPDVWVYRSLISGHTKAGSMAEAYRYYVEAVQDKLLTPSRDIFSLLIIGFCEQNDVETAHKLLREMIDKGFSPDTTVYADLIQLASKQGQWRLGQTLFSEMAEKGINPAAETYNTVIAACADAAQSDMALSVMCQMMVEKGFYPSETTFSALFSRLSELNQPDNWQRLLVAIEGMEERSKTCMCRTLVNSLTNGDKEVAANVFKLMAERGLYQT